MQNLVFYYCCSLYSYCSCESDNLCCLNFKCICNSVDLTSTFCLNLLIICKVTGVGLTDQAAVCLMFLTVCSFMRSNFNLYVNDGSRHKGKHDYKSLRRLWLVLVLTLFCFWCWPQIAKSWCCFQCMMQTSLLVISHDSEFICKINNLMASHKECLPFKYRIFKVWFWNARHFHYVSC